MNRRMALFIILLIPAGLAACGLAPMAPTNAPAIPPMEIIPATSAPIPTTVPIPSNIPVDTPRLGMPEPQGIPLTEWSGIPIMPQATAGEEDEEMYLYSANATIEEAQAFYDSRLPPLGWELFTTGTGENGATLLLYTKDDQTLTISILDLKDHIQILILFI